MDFNNWLLVGAATAVTLAFTISAYLRLLESRENIREKRIRLEMEIRDQEAKETGPRGRDLREVRSQLREQTRLLEQIASRDVIVNLRLDQAENSADGERPGPFRADSAQPGRVVREIGHSLNTPLSQVEIALSFLSNNPNLSEEDQGAVTRAVSSVALCKAFIQAFRYAFGGEAASLEQQAEQSLGDLVSRAAAVMSQRGVVCSVHLPPILDGYRPTFVLALLMPLVENAVEASPDDGEVRVWSDTTSSMLLLNVSNPLAGSLSERIYEPMYSSKPDHEGLGLAVALRLVGSVPGGKIDHVEEADTVKFTVTLPRLKP